MDTAGRKRECIEWAAAACAALIMLITVWKVLGCFFETNDDRFITGLLSGNMGGVPDAHAVYVNFIISWPLSLLYRLAGNIPWYGLFLLLCQLLVYTALFQSAWSRGKRMGERALALGFMGISILTNLYITASVQYTSTAALMAVTGYACLLLNRSSGRGWFLFAFFETMAYLLRSQAMLMLLPMGIMVCAGEFFGENAGEKKVWIRKMCRLAAIVAVIVSAGFLGTFAGYRGEGWSEFKRYNQARTELFDFYGTPEYGEVKEILDRYKVSPAEYAAFRQYMLVGRNIGTECMEELAGYQRGARENSTSVWEAIRKIPEVREGTIYYGVGRAALLICCVGLVWSLLRRHGASLVSLLAVVVSGVLTEGYLIYRGRLLLRVMLPLFFSELLFAVVIMLRDYTDRERNILQRAGMCVAAVVCVVICVLSGRQQYHSVRWEKTWQESYTEGLVEVYDYCRANLEKRYILEINSFANYRGSVLDTRMSGGQNCVYSGSWLYHSPVMDDFLQHYLESGENICLILCDNESGEEHYAVSSLAETLGRKPVPAGKLETSNGETYLVWEFVPAETGRGYGNETVRKAKPAGAVCGFPDDGAGLAQDRYLL